MTGIAQLEAIGQIKCMYDFDVFPSGLLILRMILISASHMASLCSASTADMLLGFLILIRQERQVIDCLLERKG